MPIKFKIKRKKRKRVHGFLKRMATRSGQQIIKRRRRKKRKRLTV
ncbi:MAG: 50S ribosomal protein L34 [Candidatus Nanoarchaeia archaeon]